MSLGAYSVAYIDGVTTALVISGVVGLLGAGLWITWPRPLGLVLDVMPKVRPAIRLGAAFHVSFIRLNVFGDIYPGEFVGVVGESGSGKSVSAMSILQLIPTPPGRMSPVLHSCRPLRRARRRCVPDGWPGPQA